MKRILSLAPFVLLAILAALVVHSAVNSTHAAPRTNITHVGIAVAEGVTLLPTDGTGGNAKLTIEAGKVVLRVSDPTGEIVGEAVLVALPVAPAKLAVPEVVAP